MPRIPIESVEDPRVAPYRNLGQKGFAADDGRFIAEGQWVIRRLLASEFEVESVLVAVGHEDRLDTPPDLPVYVAPASMLSAIAGFRFHRGVLACGLRRDNPTLATLGSKLTDRAVVVICQAIADPENLGGILRNCAAFDVGLVMLGNRCADPYSRRVLRVSMATVLKLPLYCSTDLEEDLVQLRDQYDVHLVASVLDLAADRLSTTESGGRLGLVFGNEGYGLDRSLIRICNQRVTIPMPGGIDSLNVAVASGVFLYHFVYHAADCVGRSSL